MFFENSEEGFLDLTIHAGGDLIQKFNDLNLSAQPRVDRSQFQANDTRADYHKFARNFVQLQSACGGYDCFFVDRNSWQARGLGARRDDDMFGLVDVIANFDLTCRRNAAPAFQPVNFIFLE